MLMARWRARLFEPQERAPIPARLLRPARLLWVIGRDILDGQLSMRAMSLVYTTLLSLVPVLALSFSVLKALGVHNQLEPILAEALSPLGPRADEITASVIGFVENIEVGVLGSLGVALLFYAAVSMIQKVEGAFNFIWRIEQARPLSQRVGEYLAVLTVGPVMVFAALGVTASLLSSDFMLRVGSVEPFGALIAGLTALLPFVLVIGAFSFLYSFIPNTRVRWWPALCGGLLAGVLWQTASLAFARFVAGASNYNAVYSGFAIFLFLLIWLYVGWLILLTGCQLAFYLQNPGHIRATRTPPILASRTAEYLGLAIMMCVTRAFVRGEPPPNADDLTDSLNAAPEHVQRQIAVLRHHGLLIETSGRQLGWMPAIDPEQISLARLWRLIRAGTEPMRRSEDPVVAPVLKLLDEVEAPIEAGRGTQSLRGFVLALEPGATGPTPDGSPGLSTAPKPQSPPTDGHS